MLVSALTLPRLEDEGVDAFMRRVEQDAAEQSAKARDLGTQIHGEIEEALKGGAVSAVAAPVLAWLKDEFGEMEWRAERSFAHSAGFGGKVDLWGLGVVIDFKTSDFGPDKKVGGWDEHKMQLAAYATGLGEPLDTVKALNLFVSTTSPGLIVANWWTAEQLWQGWTMFDALLDYWKAKRGIE